MFKCDLKVPKMGYIGTRYVNSYLWNIKVKSPDYTLSVVHRNINDAQFQSFEDTLEGLANFVDSYDILETSYGVKVFELPKVFHTEYDLFLQGKYSHYCDDAKEFCIKEAPMTSLFANKLPDVFSRRKELREYQESKIGQDLPSDAEVWSTPNMVWETLNNESQKTLRDDYGTYNRKLSVAT